MSCKVKYFFILSLISVIASCQNPNPDTTSANPLNFNEESNLVQESIDSTIYNYPWLTEYNYHNSLINVIDLPEGYERVIQAKESFASWLRHLPLKEDNTVYLFNGEKKYNQSAQHKVINIDVGTKDLQQCADAVMRLRSEYLYATNQLNKIQFNYTNGAHIAFSKWSSGYYPSLKNNKVVWVNSANNSSYKSFKKYMDNIFMYAGTASLYKELKSVELEDINVGDVFIKGGFPGHAVIVIDVIKSKETNEKCFMLAQSYMPAQNIHVLKNPNNSNLSPWYSVQECKDIVETPEWTFYPNQLKRF